MQYKTYAERYSDPCNDPYRGSYKEAMSSFVSVKSNKTLAVAYAASLATLVYQGGGERLYGFLSLTMVDDVGVINFLHHPISVVYPAGNEFKADYLILVGDQHGLSSPQSIYFPEDGFKVIKKIRVHKEKYIDAHFRDNPATQNFLAPDDQEGHDEVFTTSLMFVPPKYLSLVLTLSPLTPRKAWETLRGAIVADGLADDLAPLITWLRIALHNTPGDANRVPHALPAPIFPWGTLDRSRDTVVRCILQDLPGLTLQSSGASTGFEQGTLAALNNIATQLMGQAQPPQGPVAPAALLPKTPTQYFKGNIRTLLSITHTSSTDELPRIYWELADSTKTTVRGIVDQALQETAEEFSLLEYTPIATKSLCQKIIGCDFTHHNTESLDEGIQPFLCTCLGQSERSLLAASVRAYDDVLSGAGAASLSDLSQIKAAEKIGMPTNLYDLNYCFKGLRFSCTPFFLQHTLSTWNLINSSISGCTRK